MMNNLQESNPLNNERIFFDKNIWNRIPDDCIREVSLKLIYYFFILLIILTTTSALRSALQETQKPTGTLPPFALPRGSLGYKELHPGVALSQLAGAKAGFIGEKTAALIHKIL